MAYRRGEDTDSAWIGAAMEAEYQAAMLELVKGWFEAHKSTK